MILAINGICRMDFILCPSRICRIIVIRRICNCNYIFDLFQECDRHGWIIVTRCTCADCIIRTRGKLFISFFHHNVIIIFTLPVIGILKFIYNNKVLYIFSIWVRCYSPGNRSVFAVCNTTLFHDILYRYSCRTTTRYWWCNFNRTRGIFSITGNFVVKNLF